MTSVTEYNFQTHTAEPPVFEPRPTTEQYTSLSSPVPPQTVSATTMDHMKATIKEIGDKIIEKGNKWAQDLEHNAAAFDRQNKITETVKRVDQRYHFSEIANTVTSDVNEMTHELWGGDAKPPAEFVSGPDGSFKLSAASRPTKNYRTPIMNRK